MATTATQFPKRIADPMPLMNPTSTTTLMFLALGLFVAAASQPEAPHALLEGAGPYARALSGAAAVRTVAAAVPWVAAGAFVVLLEPMVVPLAAMFAAYRFLN